MTTEPNNSTQTTTLRAGPMATALVQVKQINTRQIAMGEDCWIETYDNRRIQINIAAVKQLVPGVDKASDMEIAAFLAFCASNGYDPFRKQAYLIKYKASDPASFVVSYHVFLDRANKHPQFDGFQMGIVWRVSNEKVLGDPCDYKEDEQHQIIGGWARVHRKDRKFPFYREVPWSEMESTYRDRDTGAMVANRNWRIMKTTMGVKTPLCRALRDAFPDELGGTYADVEPMLPPERSDLAAQVAPREEREPEGPPTEAPADEGSQEQTPVEKLADRMELLVAGAMGLNEPPERTVLSSVMLSLAAAADGGKPADYNKQVAWTPELCAKCEAFLDANGLERTWLPGGEEEQAADG